MKKVGIIGYGWVGKAMKQLFPQAIVYTEHLFIDEEGNRTEYHHVEGMSEQFQKKINECDVVFICVPTPVINEGRLDTDIVERSIWWCTAPLLVIRSTVNPGDCDGWLAKYPGKRIVMQPEYLGETPGHPMLDQKTRNFLVIGGYPNDRRALIDLYTTVYNANTTIREVTHKEAEIIKLTENRAIFYKSMQCQELYDVCEAAGVNYYTIRDAVYGDDPRFNLWWTFIYTWRRGVVSKCIPKDVYAWAAWAESVGYNPRITRELLEKNKEYIKLNG